MWDFEFTLLDGVDGAGEMTRVTSREAQEWIALNRRRHAIEDSRLAWLVRPLKPGTPRPNGKELLRHLRSVARRLELLDQRPDLSRYSSDPRFAGDESFRWLLDRGLSIQGRRSEQDPGRVVFEAPGLFAFAAPSLTDALRWIETELAEEVRYQSKFDKLRRSGCEEQHLVLRLDHEGLPADVWLAFDGATILPSRRPEVPQHITGLWLLPEFAREYVWWTSSGGWGRSTPAALFCR